VKKLGGFASAHFLKPATVANTGNGLHLHALIVHVGCWPYMCQPDATVRASCRAWQCDVPSKAGHGHNGLMHALEMEGP